MIDYISYNQKRQGGENMTFKDILRVLSAKEHTNECQIRSEMQEAIRQAGLRCSPWELVENVVTLIVNEDYIS